MSEQPELCAYKYRRSTSSIRKVTQDRSRKDIILNIVSDTNNIDYEK